MRHLLHHSLNMGEKNGRVRCKGEKEHGRRDIMQVEKVWQKQWKMENEHFVYLYVLFVAYGLF